MVSVFLLVGVSTAAANPLGDFFQTFSISDTDHEFDDEDLEIENLGETKGGEDIETYGFGFSESTSFFDNLMLSIGAADGGTIEPGDEAEFQIGYGYTSSGNICTTLEQDSNVDDAEEWDVPATLQLVDESGDPVVADTQYVPCADGEFNDFTMTFDAPEEPGSYAYDLYHRHDLTDIYVFEEYSTFHALFFGYADAAGVDKFVVESYSFTVDEEHEPPSAEINAPSEVEPGEQFELDASSTFEGSHSIEEYEWETRDRYLGTGETLTHSFSEEGDYWVTLTVTDETGELDASSTSIEVVDPVEPAEAEITGLPNNVEEGEEVTFDGSSSTGEGSIEAYTWYVDGNPVSFDQTTQHTFKEAKTYTVELEITDSEGQIDTATKTVTVEALTEAVADIDGATEVEEGSTVEFSAEDSTGHEGVQSYTWELNGEQVETGSTAQIEFENLGTQTVSLVIEDNAGQQDTESVDVLVDSVDEPVDDPVDDGDDDEEDERDEEDVEDESIIAVFWSFVSFLL